MRRLLIFIACLIGLQCPLPAATSLPTVQAAGPVIAQIATNAADYPNGRIPRYARFELTFQAETIAQNLQLPYDASPPAGVEPGQGVTINAHFTPDDWQTVFVQPAFHYQAFAGDVKDGQEWFYPASDSAWKVRFAPHQPGIWQYKLVAEDAGGVSETAPAPFIVVNSSDSGFIRVSANDPRYFEYDNGRYFPALGYNLNYRHVDWINPTLANEADFEVMADNGIQLVRTWISQWSIYGSAWFPWRSHNPDHQGYLPNPRLRHDAIEPANGRALSYPGSDTYLWLSQDDTVFDGGHQWRFNPCMVLGWESPRLPVKPDTDYRLRVRFRPDGLSGPRQSGQPYGFTVKTGNWLWSSDPAQRCDAPGVGNLLAASYSTTANWNSYPDPVDGAWQILEGRFNSGSRHFLDRLYLAIENADDGSVFVDHVWLEEDLGGGQFGPNIIYKPDMSPHTYFDQRNSYALDRLLDLADEYDVYLKLVIMEKQDFVLNIFEKEGGALSDQLPNQNDYSLFYGNGRTPSKTLWLQQAYWRYLQARWGYSPHVHSWELLNEGNPNLTAHYILADELGKYMQTAFIPDGQNTPHPNRHLVTTSFWNSFPNTAFWANGTYPYVDYADVHHYVEEDSLNALGYIYELSDFNDAALITTKLSLTHGANQANGPSKPVMRGELGWLFNGADRFDQNASDGLWLHNLLWAGLNAGGLIESYWVGSPTEDHIYTDGAHDHRPLFRPFYNFVSTIPLNNGRYQDVTPSTSTPDLRAWGQIDPFTDNAHLWLQNSGHTWRRVADGQSISPVSGTVTLSGFQPGLTYTVQWWDTREPNPAQQITSTQFVTAAGNGTLTLTVNNLGMDTAVKISGDIDFEEVYLPSIQN